MTVVQTSACESRRRPGDRLAERIEAVRRRALADPASTCGPAAALVLEARAQGPRDLLARALRAEACARRGVLAHETARALLDEAVRIGARLGDRELLAEVLVSRAVVHHELGSLRAAQRDIERAAPLVSEESSPELRLQQAAVLQNAGRLGDAAAAYRLLLDDGRGGPEVLAKVANNLALIEAQLGRPGIARAHADRALSLAHLVGPALVALVSDSRAWVTLQAGRVVESLRQFDDAGDLYREAGLPLGEHHLEHADALLELRLLREATALTRRAAVEFERHGVALMAAEARLRLARLALIERDAALARSEALLAQTAFASQGRTGWEARAAVVAAEAALLSGDVSRTTLAAALRAARTLEHCRLLDAAVEAQLAAGRVARRLGSRPVAVRALERAAALAAPTAVLVRLKGHLAAALAAETQDRPDETLRHCRAGLRDLSRHRSALPSIELRALASGHGAELGRLGLAALLREGQPTRVLEWLERTRAAALVAVQPAQPAELQEDLVALRRLQVQLARPARSEDETSDLLAQQADLEMRIRRASRARQQGPQGRRPPVGTAELRQALRGRTLVEYAVLHGELLAVVLGPRRTVLVRLGPLAPVEAEAQALLFALRRLARDGTGAGAPARVAAARASAERSLHRLRGRLLAPLPVVAEDPLVVVPSALLQRIPWAALHPAPVSVAPSAACWAASGTSPGRGRPAGRSQVVLVAGPGLPGALLEVDRLRHVYADPLVLVPPASTTSAVVAALEHADVAHLACHGRLRDDSPTLSSLLLSDGGLTLHELDLRGVSPRRLVLAVCDSGAEVGYPGDEVLGFVSATLARGAGGVVASAVSVPDRDVLPLMCGLHERVAAGATLTDALHDARAALDRDRPGEFVAWCAFNAYGAA